MTKKQCPLGDDCDLTVAWMLGRQNAKDEIAALKEQLEAARRDAKEAEAYAGELEAKLAKAMTALVEVQEFVKDLEPYAEQGHTLVPALQKACAVYAELTGEKK